MRMRSSRAGGELQRFASQRGSVGWEILSLQEAFTTLDNIADQPSVDGFISILHKCRRQRNPHHASRLHARICNNGLESHRDLGNFIVPMLVDCNSIPHALHVFDRLVHRNEHSWTSLMQGFIQCGQPHSALSLYQEMMEESIHPSRFTLIALLKACTGLRDVERGRKACAEIIRHGFEGDLLIGNTLIDMYAKCASLPEAQEAFNRLPVRDVVSWNALIAGYAQHGPGGEALKCFDQMPLEGVSPDAVTFVCILKACGSIGALDKGREIHTEIRKNQLEGDIFIGNALIDMYAKCGSFLEAQKMISELPDRDIVSWNALITGYAEHGHIHEAFKCFEQMQREGISPNSLTFVCCLKACSSKGALVKGREMHTEIIQKGFESNIFVANTLIDMYVKCRSLLEARDVFEKLENRDIISWNALIAGYAEQGLGKEALECFEQMNKQDISPNSFTFTSILKACGSIAAIEMGRELHLEIIRKGLKIDLFLGNTLVSMYTSCGLVSEAREVFDKLLIRDVVSWSTLIAGYAEHGSNEKAMECFEQMQLDGILPNIVAWTALIAGYAKHGPFQEALKYFDQMQLLGVSPDPVAYIFSLKACGSIGAIDKGREIHVEIAKRGFETDLVVGNILVDMYAKCGLLLEAQDFFSKMPVRDVVSWNTMINGCGMNNEGNMSLHCFREMEEHGMKPDAATFTCLLTACNRTGMVQRGLEYFKTMAQEYGIVPILDHYSCMVDLLARSGQLHEAENFLLSIPCAPPIEAWKALLSACKTYGEVQIGLRCFKELVQMNPDSASSYVLMANNYANAGWPNVAYRIEELRKHAGAKKKSASALIEVEKRVHEFVVGTNQSKEISAMLEIMDSCLKEEENVSNLDLICRLVSDEEKDAALCEHAEKLALAFGLLSTPPGHTLRVTKNMRMCSSCHDASKMLSRIEKRKIIIQDSYCIHHFKDGLCSCNIVS